MQEPLTPPHLSEEIQSFLQQERTAEEILAYVQGFGGWTAQLHAHRPITGQAILEMDNRARQQRCRFWLLASEEGTARLRLFAADATEPVADNGQRSAP